MADQFGADDGCRNRTQCQDAVSYLLCTLSDQSRERQRLETMVH
jgi:hypothetical protein